MLKKKNRLTKQEFNRFFSLGKKHHSPNIMLISVPHAEFHAAVVVSKKVAKTAVKRNLFRRRVYDMLRQLHTESNLTGVYIVILKHSAPLMSYTTLKNELTTLLGRTT